jgi:hypothetical protein
LLSVSHANVAWRDILKIPSREDERRTVDSPSQLREVAEGRVRLFGEANAPMRSGSPILPAPGAQKEPDGSFS